MFLVLVLLAITTRLYLTVDNLTKLIIYIVCSGGLGGLAFGAYSYSKHFAIGDFDLKWFWWYIFKPGIGVIYGLFLFFLIAGGLMTLAGIDVTQISASLYTTKAFMFYCALAFLVGYAQEPFTKQLNALAEAIFKELPKRPV